VIRIRAATVADAAAIAAIYAPFVTDTPITFETEAPDATLIGERIRSGGDLYPWYVAETDDGALAGYAYATRFRDRSAYRFAVETTVYVDPGAQRQRIGTRLYEQLFETLIAQGFTQAIAAITLPNAPSVQLHEAAGFRAAGVYRQVGYKLGAWYDVGLWQRTLAPAQLTPTEPRSIPEAVAARG
jgi:L-amino acid N-acyltransferase YncA